MLVFYQPKGYPVPEGYMGMVEVASETGSYDEYMLFASETDYREYYHQSMSQKGK